MKRVLSLIIVLAMCMTLLVCVASAEDFVPSIGDKDHPEIVPDSDKIIGQIIGEDGSVIDDVDTGCIVITPVSDAETSTEIPEAAKDELLDVYDKLSNGDMSLPYDSSVNPEDMVIRDLFDISILCDEHPQMLEDGGKLQLTFNLGVQAGDTVVCMVYVDGQWVNVELTNNGDGTVTCLFPNVCPVVFAVKQSETPPDTGDFGTRDIMLWGLLMVGSLIAFVVCVVIYRRKVVNCDR